MDYLNIIYSLETSRWDYGLFGYLLLKLIDEAGVDIAAKTTFLRNIHVGVELSLELLVADLIVVEILLVQIAIISKFAVCSVSDASTSSGIVSPLSLHRIEIVIV